MRNDRLHHVITLACNKACSYCINELKEIGTAENKKHATLEAIEASYASLSKSYSALKITGGEPSKYKRFEEISRLARRYFSDLQVITANADVLTREFDWMDEVFDSVSFSLHEPYADEFYDWQGGGRFTLRNDRNINVNLSCLSDFFERMTVDYESRPELLLQGMMSNGFNGLTIRQEWPSGKKLSCLVPTYTNFAVRYNPSYYCERQLLLMPDLSTVDNRIGRPSSRATFGRVVVVSA